MESFSDLYIFERINGNWQETQILELPRHLQSFPEISMSANGQTIAAQGGESISIFDRMDDVWEQSFIPVPFDFASSDSGSQPFSGRIDLSSDGSTLAFTPTAGIASTSNVQSNIVYVYSRNSQNWQLQASLTPSNPSPDIFGRLAVGFGSRISLSGDGNRLVVASPGEVNSESDISEQSDEADSRIGAAYVFLRNDSAWQQQARLIAPSPVDYNSFAADVEINSDGNTIVVGSPENASVNANRIDAVHVYRFVENEWQHRAILNASNSSFIANSLGNGFGRQVSISSNGNSVAVGAISESSSARGINGSQLNVDGIRSGAAYLFVFSDGIWQQRAYIKSSNTSIESEQCPFTVFTGGELREFSDSGDRFGSAVRLSGDGLTLAVSATGECSAATGINGDQTDNSNYNSGAVYLY